MHNFNVVLMLYLISVISAILENNKKYYIDVSFLLKIGLLLISFSGKRGSPFGLLFGIFWSKIFGNTAKALRKLSYTYRRECSKHDGQEYQP